MQLHDRWRQLTCQESEVFHLFQFASVLEAGFFKLIKNDLRQFPDNVIQIISRRLMN